MFYVFYLQMNVFNIYAIKSYITTFNLLQHFSWLM